MKSIKQALPWTIRIGVSTLFLLSAVAKLYPTPYFALTTFEVKQLVPMGFSDSLAAYFSRILIGVEFSLGILLLLPYYLKRVIVPATGLMLLVFIAHLGLEIYSGGNHGNCGCFGSLLPMTPLQAIIKNIISVGLLGVLYAMLKTEDRKQVLPIVNVVLASILLVFMLGMRQESSIAKAHNSTKTEVADTLTKVNSDTLKEVPKESSDVLIPIPNPGPQKKLSGFSDIFPSIDEGKKILCFFAPTCPDCKETFKVLTKLKKNNKDFPEIQIIFMDEAPEEIPAFFKSTGAGDDYPYYIMDVRYFWKRLGDDGDISRSTPGVLYLWNGNVQKFYYGTEEKKFNGKEFKKILAKE
jgi:thiol-disulfide isomerase/thioredoxin